MSKNAFAAAAALSMMVVGSAAMAASSPTATTPFTVSIKINDGCTVNTSGAVSLSGSSGVVSKTLGTAQSNTGKVTATCTNGTRFGLKLTSTNNATGTDGKFYMKGLKPLNSVTIPYTVKYTSITGATSTLVPGSGVSELLSGTASSTTSFTAGSSDAEITLTFTSGTPSAAPIADDYSDTVNVTAEF